MGEVGRHTPLPATFVSSSVPQSEAGLSPSVATCKTVFYWDGCFLLYSWHPGKRSHLQNCLIWMLGRQTHTHTFERSKLNCTQSHICARLQTLFFSFSFCPKDDAWLVLCSCWWWRAVVTVRLSVGLMHYNTALPCCVNSLSLLIENMETSHLAWYTSTLQIFSPPIVSSLEFPNDIRSVQSRPF